MSRRQTTVILPLYTVQITWRKDSKNLRIYAPDEKLLVRMTVPQRTTEKEAMAFLESKRAWLSSKTPGVPGWRPAFTPGEQHLLFGEYVPLGERDLPAGERALRKAREALTFEAVQEILPQVMALLGLPMPHVKLHTARRMPGVCYPAKNLISFDPRITCYPKAYIRYLVVHEACHLIHPHHGDAFHQLVDHLIAPARERAVHRAISAFDCMPKPLVSQQFDNHSVDCDDLDQLDASVQINPVPPPADLLMPTRRNGRNTKEVCL